MDLIRQYILGIVSAALICAIAFKMLDGKGVSAQLGKMVCGVFLMFTLLQPVSSFSLVSDVFSSESFYLDGESVAFEGQNSSREQLRAIISDRVEAYILDKASQYDAQLLITVYLSEEDIPVPESITLTGSISPYGKQQLQTMMEQELGIKKEDQKWIGR